MKLSTPKISIVVPVYNREDMVKATLDSIAAQTAHGIEVVLVDNNSVDNTYAVLEGWRDKVRRPGFDVIVSRCDTPGAAAARNAGLAIARAPWVMFFDSDDIMPSTHIAENLDAIVHNQDADIIGWDYVSTDGIVSHINRFFGTDMQWNNLFHGAMSSARWCARTDFVRNVGGWNEHVRYWDDIELGARLIAMNPRMFYRGKSGVVVLEHASSITGDGFDDPTGIEPALNSIARTLGQTLWTDIKRAIEYGVSVRGGNPLGKELMKAMLRRNSLRRKVILYFAYTHTRLGLRGAAALLKPLCH